MPRIEEYEDNMPYVIVVWRGEGVDAEFAIYSVFFRESDAEAFTRRFVHREGKWYLDKEGFEKEMWDHYKVVRMTDVTD